MPPTPSPFTPSLNASTPLSLTHSLTPPGSVPEDYYFLSDNPFSSISYRPNDPYPFFVLEPLGQPIVKEKGAKATAGQAGAGAGGKGARAGDKGGVGGGAQGAGASASQPEDKKRGRPTIAANYKHSFVYQMSSALTTVFRQLLSLAMHEDRAPDSGRTDPSSTGERADPNKAGEAALGDGAGEDGLGDGDGLTGADAAAQAGAGDAAQKAGPAETSAREGSRAGKRRIRRPKPRTQRRDPGLGVLEEMDEEEEMTRRRAGAGEERRYALDGDEEEDEVGDGLDELSWEEDEDEDYYDEEDMEIDLAAEEGVVTGQSGERANGRSGDQDSDEDGEAEQAEEDEELEDDSADGKLDVKGKGKGKGKGRPSSAGGDGTAAGGRRKRPPKKGTGSGSEDGDDEEGDEDDEGDADKGDDEDDESDEYSEEAERNAALASGDEAQYQMLLKAKAERDKRREKRRQKRIDRQRRREQEGTTPAAAAPVSDDDVPKFYGVVTPWVSSLPKIPTEDPDLANAARSEEDEDSDEDDLDVLSPVPRRAPWLTSGITPGESSEDPFRVADGLGTPSAPASVGGREHRDACLTALHIC